MSTPTIRHLPSADIALIGQIDRSERVSYAYRIVDGALEHYPVDWDIPSWFEKGTGDHHVASNIETWRPVVDNGGVLLGAYRGDSLAGLAIVVPEFEGDLAWLAFLHISGPHRRSGAGAALWADAVRRSRQAGATRLYVSAIPSGPAIDFYVSHGCVPTTTPHPALLAKEPEDIHLICEL